MPRQVIIWPVILAVYLFCLAVLFFGVKVLRNPRDAWQQCGEKREMTEADEAQVKRDALWGMAFGVLMILLATVVALVQVNRH